MKKNDPYLLVAATKDDIYRQAIPADNSFCINIMTKKDGYVAKEQVTIVRAPYKETIKTSLKKYAKSIEVEFIDVLTVDKNYYRILNKFTKIIN